MEFSPLGAALFINWRIVLGIIIAYIAGRWKIFEKAGQPGWAAIVPIYSSIVFLKIIGKPWWWLPLSLIPPIGLIWAIWGANMAAKSFGKDSGYTVGLIFLPFIFYPILGFGDAKYLGPYGDPVLFANMQNEQNGFDFERDLLDHQG